MLFTAAAVAQSAAGKSTAEANKAVVKRAFAALNQGDLKTLNELFDPAGPWHHPHGKTMPQDGPFTELAKSCPMCAALEQRKILTDVMVAESDLVSVRSTWSGLYIGTARGISFQQRPVTVVYFNIYRVSGGRIRETGLNTTLCRWPSVRVSGHAAVESFITEGRRCSSSQARFARIADGA